MRISLMNTLWSYSDQSRKHHLYTKPDCIWQDALICMELRSWFAPVHDDIKTINTRLQYFISKQTSTFYCNVGWLTVDKPTDKSARKVSSVSPLRWLAITPQPALLAILTASILSVTDPIWLTCLFIHQRSLLRQFQKPSVKNKVGVLPLKEEHCMTFLWLPSQLSAQEWVLEIYIYNHFG